MKTSDFLILVFLVAAFYGFTTGKLTYHKAAAETPAPTPAPFVEYVPVTPAPAWRLDPNHHSSLDPKPTKFISQKNRQ